MQTLILLPRGRREAVSKRSSTHFSRYNNNKRINLTRVERTQILPLPLGGREVVSERSPTHCSSTTTYPMKPHEDRVYIDLTTISWGSRGCFRKTLNSFFQVTTTTYPEKFYEDRVYVDLITTSWWSRGCFR